MGQTLGPINTNRVKPCILNISHIEPRYVSAMLSRWPILPEQYCWLLVDINMKWIWIMKQPLILVEFG